MWMNGTLLNWSTGSTEAALPNDFGSYGFGPIASYESHYCSQETHFTYSNIVMTTESSKKFSEVIREPEWRSSSLRFVVNLEDGLVSDFDDSVALGEILTRMDNEDIHYIGWGTSTNQTQANSFIAKNDSRGTFTNNTNYSQAITDTADYIYNIFNTAKVADAQYILQSNPQVITVNPAEYASNTIDSAWPQGKWKILHTPSEFENSSSTVPYHNMYLDGLNIELSEVGKYEFTFMDNLVKTVYVHRMPVASFSATLDESYNVSINDSSYDLDMLSQPDKGIAQYDWMWKETTDTTWTSGQPSQFVAEKNYIIRLRVKDYQGAWSTAKSVFVSTTSGVTLLPIADFNASPAELKLYNDENTITIDDNSYSPQVGGSITSREWSITKGGSEVFAYTGTLTSVNIGSFSDSTAGTYKISERVYDGTNWSEWSSKFVTIIDDTLDPTISADIESGNFTTTKTVEITFDDLGGSGFYIQKYSLSSSSSAPGTWSAPLPNTTRTVYLNSVGTYYIHVYAEDNAGNITETVYGPYVLSDNQAPTTPQISMVSNSATYTSGDWTKYDVDVTIGNSTDNFGSVTYKYKIDNGNWTTGSAYIFTDSGTYVIYAKSVDVNGNESNVVSASINIDKVAPSNPVINTVNSDESTYNSGDWTNQTVYGTINGSSDVNPITYKYSFDQTNWVNGSSFVVTLEGTTIVYAKAVDSVLNESQIVTSTIMIDKTKPTQPKATLTTNNGTYNKNVRVNITVLF